MIFLLKYLGIIAVVSSGYGAEATGCIGQCPIDATADQPAVFLPHQDCSQYCICDFGRPIEMQCPGGLHFSMQWSTCSDPSIAGCAGKRDNGSKISKTISESPVYHDATAKGCIKQCPSSIIAVVPHNDCTKYCMCVNGLVLVRNCSKGLHYSNKLGDCVDPNDAKCDLKIDYKLMIIPPIDPSIANGCREKCPSDYNALIPHTDCTKYCQCLQGKAVVQKCPSGLYYSNDEADCVHKDEANCEEVSPADDAIDKGCKERCPSGYNVIIEHQKCQKYCQCIKGKVIVKNCPASLHYSKKDGECIHPDDAECYEDGVPVVVPSDDDAIAKGCRQQCPSWSYMQYISHEDCTKFCRCKCGTVDVVQCPLALHFNPSTKLCDFPALAGCDDDEQ